MNQLGDNTREYCCTNDYHLMKLIVECFIMNGLKFGLFNSMKRHSRNYYDTLCIW